jgi:hypothetical protein
MNLQTKTPENIWPIAVKNVSGARIPGYAVLRVSEAKKDANGELLVEVAKPNGSGQIMLNSPMPIPIGGFGRASNEYPAPVLFDGTIGSLSVGDVLTQESDNWKAVTGTTGEFVCIGTDGDEAIVVAPGGSGGGGSGKLGVAIEDIAGATRVAWDSLTTAEKTAIGETCNLENADTAGETVYVYRVNRGKVQPCQRLSRVVDLGGGSFEVNELILPEWESDGGAGYQPAEATWRNSNSQSVAAGKLLQGKEINVPSSETGAEGGGGGELDADIGVVYIDVESC